MREAPGDGIGPASKGCGPDEAVAAAAWALPWSLLPRRPSRLPSLARCAVPTVSGALVAALTYQVYTYERDFITLAFEWKSIALVAACAAFLAGGLCLLTRRPLASIGAACGLLVMLTLLSLAKYAYLRASLHALDLYYYVRPTELAFLYGHYPRLALAGLAALLLAAVAAWWLFAADETRLPRGRAAGAFALAALSLAAAFHWRGERDKIYHFVGWYHVSAVIASSPEAAGVLVQGGLLQAADRGGQVDSTPVRHLQNADAGAKKPTILMILHESTFPTGLYPAQCGGPVPQALYTSSNGKRYDLRVETFGGATWITEYGLMLGLSTYAFGDARSFIGYTMEDRVHDSLALQMRRNGYRSLALYPSPKSFVNTGRFYRSIGFDDVRDSDDLGARSELEPDRFYYGKAIAAIRAHKASDANAPLFLALWTMATHGPYDAVLHPDVPPAPGAVCAKDKPWAEYIRRLLQAEADLAWLTGRLKAEFPDEPFMIVGYGDHQPYIAQDFLHGTNPDPRVPARDSIAYRTFFRITGIGYEPDWSVLPSGVDTPFLGNVTMLAARLPRFGFYNDRDRLMELCRGRYDDCPHQDEILSFHERMIRAGTIASR